MDVYDLGIDFGTTTLKIAVVNFRDKKIVAGSRVAYGTYEAGEIASNKSKQRDTNHAHVEQNVEHILSSLEEAFAKLR